MVDCCDNINTVISSFDPFVSNKETFSQDFSSEILENLEEIFSTTTYIVMFIASSNLQPHNSVLPSTLIDQKCTTFSEVLL